MIKFIEVLNQNELKRCVDLVHSLKKYYEPLPEGFNFETLGAASYLHYGNEHLDDEQTNSKYHTIKSKSNPILLENFKWLYDILIQYLLHSCIGIT